MLQTVHMARAVEQPFDLAHALQLAGLAVAQCVEPVGNGVLEFDLGRLAGGITCWAGFVQPLGFARDAPERIARQQRFAQQLIVRAECARGQQAPDSIPFEALAGDLVGGNVGAAMAGQDEFGEPPGLVPAVVGG